MKSIINVLLFFVILQSFSQNQVSTKGWQEDLRFLQKTIHRDYSHLFKKISAEDFDQEVEELYTEIPNMEPHEVSVAMSRMVSLFQYGHTQVPFWTVAKDGVLPINLYHFSDGIYVEGALKQYQSVVGAKVLEIGGKPIEDVLEKVRPVVPAENDWYYKSYGIRFLTVPAVLHAQKITSNYSDDVVFTLEKNGEVFEYAFPKIDLDERSIAYNFTNPNEKWLSARAQTTTPLYLKHLNDKFYYFEYLPQNEVLYVRQSSVFNDENESLKDFYNRLFEFIDKHPVDKLIYDVRLNGGGNNYNNLQFIKGIMARPEINKKGKFFFIIGRQTFSACQNLTNEITRYTEAILVGEPTAENVNFYGDARPIILPKSKIKAYLSYVWWQDAPQWENKEASLPQIAAEMSFQDYINNNDVVLSAALNYADTDFVLKPMEHLTNIFLSGDYEKLKSESIKIAHNPEYKYYDFQKEFNTAAQRLLGSGDSTSQQQGLYILQLITEVYPESQSCWYSLASALETMEMLDKAKETYKKVMSLNPKSMLGKASKNRIDVLNHKN